ncbi:insulin-like growth factor-binding protein complex acid labile subunit [Anabrus simplex]|uniref:insulin-like growth factor-binding protein complex acid labile subunit n=1 Tax=Anabrus simplex TaxID=316456 RepID=UPI0035A3C041
MVTGSENLSKMISSVFVMFLLLAATGREALCELEEQECPEDCDCHYFRINWVTDCSESNLTTIPHDGLSLNVYVLNMNGNNVTEIQPFPADIKLRRFQIADNQLTRLTGESFAGLGYMLDADFSGNQISYVDPNAFKDSPGLITLELQHNRLVPVDGPFLTSQSLMYLDLSDNLLSELSPHFFSNCTALNKLDLSGNPLTSLGPGIFDPLTSLEDLKLNRCNITHLADTTFSNLTHLQILELSENFLSAVDWTMVLGNLGRLELLDLRKSAVSHLPGDTFSNNTWMRTLILAENELRDLDVATTLGQNLLHLDSLDLSNCHLRGPLSEDAFANATKLRTLVLSGNSLSANDLSVALIPLTRLHKLSLRNCGLTRLPGNTFHRLTSLEELDISMNPLNNAFTGILSPLESLEFLDMSYSNLSHISRTTFSNMNHLKRLVLSGNHLTDLEYGLFQNLTRLETLELNNCKLTHPPDAKVFVNDQAYSNLKELRLSGNPIVVSESEPLLPPQLSSIQVLDISNCNITRIPNNLFNTTPNITNLKLAGNHLRSDSNSDESALKFLETLPHIEVLDLKDCDLTYVQPKDFAHNPNISSLQLTGNPWKCNCNIVDMWEWALIAKGDIGVLVGSTTSPSEITAGGIKRKKGLTCRYDSLKHPPLPTSRGRSRDLHLSRTWARYVKESGCESTRISRFDRHMSMPQAQRSASNSGNASFNERSSNWLAVGAFIAVVAFLATVIGSAFVIMLKRAKKHQNKNLGYPSEVVTSHFSDIDDLRPRQRIQN